jgi:hypothetical protein
MTILISILGFIGRAAGNLLTSALGWASSLLFGRVPQSHQIYVTLLMAASFLWVATIALTLLPGVAPTLLDTTPHPQFIGIALLRSLILIGLVVLPVLVGVAGYLAPAAEDRTSGLAAVRQVLAGYPLALLMAGILVFLALVAAERKIASRRRGWADVHVPIVVKPGGYERMVDDLEQSLDDAGLTVTARPAPRVLSMPGKLLARFAGRNVGALVPDRLVQLNGPDLAIDLYPSDIAISGTREVRMQARAVFLRRLLWTSAHFTTSAEAQAIEDQIQEIAQSCTRPRALPEVPAFALGQLAAIDRALVSIKVPIDEWDILYRLRVQVERDVLLAGNPENPPPIHPRAAIAAAGATADSSAVGTATATATAATQRVPALAVARPPLGPLP